MNPTPSKPSYQRPFSHLVEAILKEIHHECSLEGLLLKLKLQYFEHLMERANSLKKTLMLEKVKGKRRKGQQRMKWLNRITSSVNMNLSKLYKIVEGRGAWSAIVYWVGEPDMT